MKKIFAVLTALTMLLSFTACNNGNDIEEKETATTTESTVTDSETVTDSVTEASTETSETTDITGTDVSVADTDTETETEAAKETEGSTTKAAVKESTTATTEKTTLAVVSTVSSDPSKWSKEEIVAFYRNAAIKSKTKVKSKEMKELEEMVVNDGDGVLGTLVEWVTPFLIKALEDSEVEFDGITGGYEKLVPSDVKSAKAYKSGDYTVVEMTMHEQTDGIHDDRYEGSVGHAISVVGDIASVAEALSFLTIDFENADIKLHYTQPMLKVKINKDGIIEKGTWSYNIDITVSNLHVAAVKFPIEATVESGHGKVNYIITVGGGF